MVSLDHPELQSVASMMRNQALIKKNPQQSQEQPVLQSVFPVMRNQALIKKLPPPQQLPLVVFDDDKVLEDRAGSLPRNAKLVPTGGGPPGYLVVPDQERYSFFTDDDGKSDESVFSEDFDGDSQQLPLALDHDKAPLENEGSSSPIPLPSNANQSAQNCSITDPADESPSEQGELGHSTASLQHGIRLQEPLVASEQQPEFQSVVPVMRNQRLMKKTPFQHQEQPVLHLEAPEAKNQTLLKKPAPKQVVHEQPLTQLVAPVMRSQKLLATKKDVQQLPLALDNGEGSCSPIFSLPSNNAKSAQECSKKPSSSGYERCSIDHHGLRSSSIVSAAGDSSDEDSVEEY